MHHLSFWTPRACMVAASAIAFPEAEGMPPARCSSFQHVQQQSGCKHGPCASLSPQLCMMGDSQCYSLFWKPGLYFPWELGLWTHQRRVSGWWPPQQQLGHLKAAGSSCLEIGTMAVWSGGALTKFSTITFLLTHTHSYIQPLSHTVSSTLSCSPKPGHTHVTHNTQLLTYIRTLSPTYMSLTHKPLTSAFTHLYTATCILTHDHSFTLTATHTHSHKSHTH